MCIAAWEREMTMMEYFRTLNLLAIDRKGVTAVEYAVIAGVIVVAIATAFTTLGGTLTTFFTNLSL
jgi:pilus assembly protein Flp/PilA